MRVLLFTGKGGVGKTTTAAATALLAASRGLKTLVLSTDPAHSLADAFGVALGPEPTFVDTGLDGMQVDSQGAFERSWREVQTYLRAVLERAGVDALQADELTVLPGAEEVLALLELRHQVASGRYDLVVVDCAPTGETLRLLALPEALRWYVEKAFPAHRRALRAVRPLLSRVTQVPDGGVFEAVARLHRELAEVREILTAPTTSVRVVLTPEAVVVAEARRTLTSLALYGYRVD
ncbi:MAG: ArsA family ATPase, partial [Frankiales bacterium]|nr:ArsA family ATPase [Frankiales bacterium]